MKNSYTQAEVAHLFSTSRTRILNLRTRKNRKMKFFHINNYIGKPKLEISRESLIHWVKKEMKIKHPLAKINYKEVLIKIDL